MTHGATHDNMAQHTVQTARYDGDGQQRAVARHGGAHGATQRDTT